jgi:hypothetical protein
VYELKRQQQEERRENIIVVANGAHNGANVEGKIWQGKASKANLRLLVFG